MFEAKEVLRKRIGNLFGQEDREKRVYKNVTAIGMNFDEEVTEIMILGRDEPEQIGRTFEIRPGFSQYHWKIILIDFRFNPEQLNMRFDKEVAITIGEDIIRIYPRQSDAGD